MLQVPMLMLKKPTTTDSRLIDSHCHLLDEPLFSKLPEVIQAAFVSGVQEFIVPCSHVSDMPTLANLVAEHACIIPAFGVHPFYVAETGLAEAMDVLQHHLQHYPQA